MIALKLQGGEDPRLSAEAPCLGVSRSLTVDDLNSALP